MLGNTQITWSSHDHCLAPSTVPISSTPDADAPLRSRVAAGLLLLYAQPVSRIVRLTLDDIVQDDDHVLIRLGNPPSPVPQPFAALLLDYAADRSNMHTATNPGATWLFPGRRANQLLRPEHLAALVHELGVPTVAGRGAAIREHVLAMPAPIVADALGYHHVTTTRSVTHAGATWSRIRPWRSHTISSTPNPRQLNTRPHQSATPHHL
jgi:integrase